MGRADVYLDGVFQRTVNLYASTVAYRQNVWSTGFLAPGLHTVRLVRASTSGAGKYVNLDAIDVWGVLR
jgi:hypothetical protein